ncbi:glycosyltransferase family 4 protein [Allorhizobium sp. BGMRC 0089]|uniref:glycosyltransferase family 4 protein n=1 Tax=Allorhizobium sonneratiae TaxID=2934936 RepID=UPI002033A571|nr:glycosyltransferase family 4 protein [Allorhizobium sonneratiae]MCM2290713.1 glycosyltransferase family 4 protein [Allorhizobium sonneratiae]
MKIAFYAPLKSPDHPVPSGDRLMARLLIEALRLAGHEVTLASRLRAFHKEPDTVLDGFDAAVEAELARLTALYRQEGAPDLWFCYHPYYKAPDRIGPVICERFSCPLVTVEASYSSRRNLGRWAEFQAELVEMVRGAAVNLCFTERDRAGLLQIAPQARLERLSPFIDAGRFLSLAPHPQAGELITVAMMRPGDKMMSYGALAEALHALGERPFRLTVIGDGPCRAEVEAAFASFAPDRVRFLGECAPDQVAVELSRASLYVWPGHGEAYGLAYLEAQAAGLPVVAEAVAGVPEVVRHGVSGFLTPPGDPQAFAKAITRLLDDEDQRMNMAQRARDSVWTHHSLEAASRRLSAIIDIVIRRH